jgi:hypothetical protein
MFSLLLFCENKIKMKESLIKFSKLNLPNYNYLIELKANSNAAIITNFKANRIKFSTILTSNDAPTLKVGGGNPAIPGKHFEWHFICVTT